MSYDTAADNYDALFFCRTLRRFYMNIEELYLKRQSTRKYSEKPVADETLEKVCRLGALAPSAKNSQPWKMFTINGEKAKKFAPCVQMFGANKWTNSCPAFIVLQLNRSKMEEKIAEKFTFADFSGNDIGLLTAYIVLAAEDMGLQTCILGIRDEKAIAEFLGEPEGTHYPLSLPRAMPKRAIPYAKRTENPSTRYSSL